MCLPIAVEVLCLTWNATLQTAELYLLQSHFTVLVFSTNFHTPHIAFVKKLFTFYVTNSSNLKMKLGKKKKAENKHKAAQDLQLKSA